MSVLTQGCARLYAQVVVDIKPNEALQRQFIERNPVTTNVQVGPTYAEHEASFCATLPSRLRLIIHLIYITASDAFPGKHEQSGHQVVFDDAH